MELIGEPLAYEFFRLGLLASVLVGLVCGLIGVYVVLRHMSYIGHGLSHAVFGGAVVAYVMSVDFYLGAGLWGFTAALIIDAMASEASPCPAMPAMPRPVPRRFSTIATSCQKAARPAITMSAIAGALTFCIARPRLGPPP